MISVDNERAPFIKGKAGYRTTGVKDYVVPSTGQPLEGTGSGDAGNKIWKPAMEAYLDGLPATPFDPAPASLVYGSGAQDGPLGNDPFGNGDGGQGQNARPGRDGRR